MSNLSTIYPNEFLAILRSDPANTVLGLVRLCHNGFGSSVADNTDPEPKLTAATDGAKLVTLCTRKSTLGGLGYLDHPVKGGRA